MQVPTIEAVRRPRLWLEEVHKEETKIREIEQKIGEARRNEQPTDALADERRRTYDAWISRLDRELKIEKNEARQDSIRKQLERVKSSYS